jgi:3-methyl-2-oxobutanoate hydroxymethyltransferase
MIYGDAIIAQEAGAVGIEVEAIPPQIAKKITENINIITYSIGAGPHCDAQLLISWDMLGLFDLFKPKFVKRYSNLAVIAQKALEDYKQEVSDGTFPAEEHTYSMSDEELGRFEEMFKASGDNH